MFEILNPPLDRLHALHGPLQTVGDRFGLFAVELQIFEAVDNLVVVFGDAVQQRLAPARRDPFAFQFSSEFFPVVGAAANLADLIEQPFFVDFFVFEIFVLFVALFLDDLAHANLVLGQLFAEIENVAQRQRIGQDFVDDPILAFFDLLGDLDFALAAEQRHRAHLAQVHAHRIAGLADHVTVDIALSFFLLFLFFGDILARTAERHPLIGVHHFNVHLAKDRHDIVDLIRRHHLGRQHVVDVVVG